MNKFVSHYLFSGAAAGATGWFFLPTLLEIWSVQNKDIIMRMRKDIFKNFSNWHEFTNIAAKPAYKSMR